MTINRLVVMSSFDDAARNVRDYFWYIFKHGLSSRRVLPVIWKSEVFPRIIVLIDDSEERLPRIRKGAADPAEATWS